VKELDDEEMLAAEEDVGEVEEELNESGDEEEKKREGEEGKEEGKSEDRPPAPAPRRALPRLTTSLSILNGFYRSHRPIGGRYLLLLAIALANNTGFMIIRANTGAAGATMTRTGLRSTYEKVSPTQAKNLWDQIYEDALTRCNHRGGCLCTQGMRILTTHVLCGGGCVCTYLSAYSQNIPLLAISSRHLSVNSLNYS
jgi:hypothetical protein